MQPVSPTANPCPQLGDFADLLEQFHVPGATIAVWQDGALHEAAAGLTNLHTRVDVTPDTLFQIGSITKLYTTTLILQLAHEGKLSLDDKVRDHLPDFRMGDETISAGVTIRHLLTHTSGIDGDFFVDAGRGEDRIEKFVGMLGVLPALHPLGERFAYCNVGFVIAGRIVEVLTGLTWDKAIRQRIAKPLGTPRFSTLPEQAMRFRTAIGHLGNGETGLMVTPLAYLAQSNAPAGSTPMAAASDVIAFARMLLDGGVAPTGERLLSEEAVSLMRTPHMICPPDGPLDAIGVGAFLWHWGGGDYNVFGHDGSTIGQAAFLRIHPESGTIVVLLTNGGDGKGLSHTLMTRIFSRDAGVQPHSPSTTHPSPKELGPFTGLYGKSSESAQVTARGGRLFVIIRPSAAYNVISDGHETELLCVGEGHFIGYARGMSQPVNYSFHGHGDSGKMTYLYSGARIFIRTEAKT